MRVRAIAALLSFVGPASIAYADVSLTDEQVYARALRYSARTPSQGVIAGLAVGQIPRLIDATGLEWFINDEVTYATANSAVGAASDAAFVAAVEATTARAEPNSRIGRCVRWLQRTARQRGWRRAGISIRPAEPPAIATAGRSSRRRRLTASRSAARSISRAPTASRAG